VLGQEEIHPGRDLHMTFFTIGTSETQASTLVGDA
jgi:hypothetical protein